MKKKDKSKYRRNAYLSGILLLILINFVSSVNIGVSPASISFNDLLRGGYSERNIVVSADSEDNITAVLKPRGEIAEWLNFSAEEFNVSKNKPFVLRVSILPPVDIPNGNYSGYLRIEISGKSQSIEEHAVGTVKSSLDLAINTNIIDTEIVKCTASGMEIISSEKGDDVVLKMNVLNQGNVRLKPEVVLDIWDSEEISIIKTEKFKGEEILPSTKKNLEFRFNSKDLDIGQYWSNAYVIECSQLGSLTFDVLEPGALSAKGTLMNILTRGTVNVGETSAIISNFKNTGEKEINAQFKGKVTLGGKIVEVLESDAFRVPVSKVETFNFYFTPKKEGRYVVSGRVYYEGKKTFEQSSFLEAVSQGFNYSILVYVAFVFVIGFLIYIIRKEKRTYLNRLKNIK